MIAPEKLNRGKKNLCIRQTGYRDAFFCRSVLHNIGFAIFQINLNANLESCLESRATHEWDDEPTPPLPPSPLGPHILFPSAN